ncbi:MAG TPA: hypothetical protein DD407_02565 [Pseudohongiella sp.]|nr:hypothetical protein [Gammaproteobacteria bacterium]HBN13895.1 hypothetical protein [Pseudohongiella sp.]
MSIELIVVLAGLALIDSTSIGTLLIPIWLLLDHRQIDGSRLLIYLLTIAGFYLVVGLTLALGADWLLAAEPSQTGADAQTQPGILDAALSGLQLLVGAGLFWISFRFDSSKPGAAERVERWKQRTHQASTSTRVLISLALLAALAEVATMLPYLGAIAMMTAADLSRFQLLILMPIYCLIMILPAIVLLLLRQALHDQIQSALIKVDQWISRNAESALGWTLGIAGFLIAQDAIGRLYTIYTQIP